MAIANEHTIELCDDLLGASDRIVIDAHERERNVEDCETHIGPRNPSSA
jgi:hypothetical protein